MKGHYGGGGGGGGGGRDRFRSASGGRHQHHVGGGRRSASMDRRHHGSSASHQGRRRLQPDDYFFMESPTHFGGGRGHHGRDHHGHGHGHGHRSRHQPHQPFRSEYGRMELEAEEVEDDEEDLCWKGGVRGPPSSSAGGRSKLSVPAPLHLYSSEVGGRTNTNSLHRLLLIYFDKISISPLLRQDFKLALSLSLSPLFVEQSCFCSIGEVGTRGLFYTVYRYCYCVLHRALLKWPRGNRMSR